ncbi:MAG: bifunctional oligoribonuclease/PAP phosphatase NrnA, partial [Planctomycetota bacterium]
MVVALDTKSRVDELLRVLEGRKRVVVLSHNNPDPDSMGGGLGVRFLMEKAMGVETAYAYRGHIHRAENIEMVRSLGLSLVKVEDIDLSHFDGLVLVDTQPGFGHTILPEGRAVDAVIDHHVPPAAESPCEVLFNDVRTDVGATCSIVTGYLMDLGLEITPRVATALLYGIRTDTADLSRNTNPLDEKAYIHLMARADRQALARISKPSVPKRYFSALRKALNATRIFGKITVCSLGVTDNPQIIAEVADLLLRLEGTEWVVTGGLYEEMY